MPSLRAPFLREITLRDQAIRERDTFPFTLPCFAAGFEVALREPVTFVLGENGAGKSTLLEAIALGCGFSPYGGSRNQGAGFMQRVDEDDPGNVTANDLPEESLARALRFSWLPKVTKGFFFRAESFFDLTRYLADGAELHTMSHGEAFLHFMNARLGEDRRAIYILDEPEAALSPARQLEFLRLVDRWRRSGNVQAFIATHSPILMAYPHAQLMLLDEFGWREAKWRETSHYAIYKRFLNDPEAQIERWLAEE
jgi:predicted ATPase